MKIEFEKISPPYCYPVSFTEARHILNEVIPEDFFSKIAKLHFGCNRQTTQEARIVGRGCNFELRINFCPKDGKTKLLSEKREWCGIVELCGGSIDRDTQSVSWKPDSARKYSAFLIAHEIAHIIYAERNGFSKFNGPKSSASEEAWCDSFAKEAVSKLTARHNQAAAGGLR
jgi:hypothetical protein